MKLFISFPTIRSLARYRRINAMVMIGLLLSNDLASANNILARAAAHDGPAHAGSAGPNSPGGSAPIPTPTKPPSLALGQAIEQTSMLAKAASKIMAAQSQQSTAHQNPSNPSYQNIGNGLIVGGLNPSSGLLNTGVANSVSNDPGWVNALTPKQRLGSDGITHVDVDQTAAQALMTWNTFNVGSKTEVDFNQTTADGTLLPTQLSSWVAYNRVVGTLAPSVILGSIKAAGQVYVINQNGVLFANGSQVNTSALIASTADLNPTAYFKTGIYSTSSGGIYTPSFANVDTQGNLVGNTGSVTVEEGARITTTPATLTAGAGYVLLMGGTVDNEGSITTDGGQTVLAAGDAFNVRRGYNTTEIVLGQTAKDANGKAIMGNTWSTTQGNEVAAVFAPAPGQVDGNGNLVTHSPVSNFGSGKVLNQGIIQASRGDVTLVGEQVVQNGVITSTTSTSKRGTIHLLTSDSDPNSSIIIGSKSLMQILPTDDGITETLAAHDGRIADSLIQNGYRLTDPALQSGQSFDDYSLTTDNSTESRIEINSGGTIEFQNDSSTAAYGGQISATGALANIGSGIKVDTGATLDVSGIIASIPLSQENILVTIEGNQLRDSPSNRDTGLLVNNQVYVNAEDLIYVPAGTDGFATDRYYTPGGLLEVSGEVLGLGHTALEYSTVGGNVQLTSDNGYILVQNGSTINISGGATEYTAADLMQSYLSGPNGSIVNVNQASPYITYTGVHTGKPSGLVQTPVTFRIQGRTVGRDGGNLSLESTSVAFAGKIESAITVGSAQTQSRSAIKSSTSNPLSLYRETVTPQGGTLNITPIGTGTDVKFTTSVDTSATPASGEVLFDVNVLNTTGLGGISVSGPSSVEIEAALQLGVGGALNINATSLDIAADITTYGGAVNLSTNGGDIIVEPGVIINSQGAWTNAQIDSAQVWGAGYVNGGNISMSSVSATFTTDEGITYDKGGNIIIEPGSILNASAGGYISSSGKVLIGNGGNVTLSPSVGLGLNGSLESYGLKGGVLTINLSQDILIANNVPSSDTVFSINPQFFQSGFSQYNLSSAGNIDIASGTQINVLEPVYQLQLAAYILITGSNPQDAYSTGISPLYSPNSNLSVAQRGGASISLTSTNPEFYFDNNGTFTLNPSAHLVLGDNASITVDPGQSISLAANGQITILGNLTAHAGHINITNISPDGQTNTIYAVDPTSQGANLSLWLGNRSSLDVSGEGYVSTLTNGAKVGLASDAGTVNLHAGTGFLIIQPGAQIDANGTQVAVNLASSSSTLIGGYPLTELDSNGGTISFESQYGIFNEGSLKAFAGGAKAAGGTFNVNLEYPRFPLNGDATPSYSDPAYLIGNRTIFIGQTHENSGLILTDPSDAIDPSFVGLAYLSADQIKESGFGSLSLQALQIEFDGNVQLNLSKSVTLNAYQVVNAVNATVNINTPYLFFAGTAGGDFENYSNINIGGGINAYGSGSPIAPLVAMEGVPDDASSVPTFNFSSNFVDLKSGSVFGNVNITSQSDIRLSNDTDGSYKSSFFASNNLSLAAQRIFADSFSNVTLVAGNDLSIRNLPGTAADTQIPTSGFSTINLNAATIEQGGALFAPFGTINFNGQTELLSGSLTSISSAGLILPIGGTLDNLQYTISNVDITKAPYSSLFNGNGFVGLAGTIYISSGKVDQGAVLDFSGGGELQGKAFVEGRGGSVDSLLYALPSFADPSSPAYNTNSNNQVFAIIAGNPISYAPSSANGFDPNPANPQVGQQITIPSGIPGLPAGTYTLLPANYALLAGGYRVELMGNSILPVNSPNLQANGTYLVNGIQSIRGTQIQNSRPTLIDIASGAVTRKLSTYDETTFTQTTNNYHKANPTYQTPWQPANSGNFNFISLTSFQGVNNFNTGINGVSGGLVINSNEGNIYVVPDGFMDPDISGTVLPASLLDSLDLNSLTFYFPDSNNGVQFVIEPGADLRVAGDIFFIQERQNYANSPYQDSFIFSAGSSVEALGNITFSGAGATYTQVNIQQGSVIISDKLLSFNKVGLQLDAGNDAGVKAHSLSLQSSEVNIGTSAALTAAAAAQGVDALQGINISIGALNQIIGSDLINSQSSPSLAGSSIILQASDAINLYGSFSLDTSRLAAFEFDAPGINGFGTSGDQVSISGGKFVWNTSYDIHPTYSIYDNGYTGDKITLNSNSTFGSGQGVLSLAFANIVLGSATPGMYLDGNRAVIPEYWAITQSFTDKQNLSGFSTINIGASAGLLSTNKTSIISFSQPSGLSAPTVNINAPLLSTAGSTVTYQNVGGTLNLGNANTSAQSEPVSSQLGAESDFVANIINVNEAIVNHSGNIKIDSTQRIELGANAILDVSGLPVTVGNETEFGAAGNITIISEQGDITQDAGQLINLSAIDNVGGVLTLTAAHGTITLNGTLLAESNPYIRTVTIAAAQLPMPSSGNILGRAALRTHVANLVEQVETPSTSLGGSLILNAQSLLLPGSGALDNSLNFAAINNKLNSGGFNNSRSFEIGQGSLTTTGLIKAQTVIISVDQGDLTVGGTIDASGTTPGTIRLSADGNLSLYGTLNASASTLQVDSYGNPENAQNRATVQLTAGHLTYEASSHSWGNATGILTLEDGSVIDVSVPSPSTPQGVVELNVMRSSETGGDANIQVNDTSIRGAKNIDVNAFWNYSPYDNGSSKDAKGNALTGSTIVQDNQIQSDGTKIPGTGALDGSGRLGLAQVNAINAQYITAALTNSSLIGKLGKLLTNSAFHFRPGVQIESNAAVNDNLIVGSTLDLHTFRYTSFNPSMVVDGKGGGEPGVLVIRASNNLYITNSISDGFSAPPSSPNDVIVYDEYLKAGTSLSQVTLTYDGILAPGTTIPTTSGALNFSINVLGSLGTTYNTLSAIYAVLGQDVTLTGNENLPDQIIVPEGYDINFNLVHLASNTVSVTAGPDFVFTNIVAPFTTQADWLIPIGALTNNFNTDAKITFKSPDGASLVAYGEGDTVPAGWTAVPGMLGSNGLLASGTPIDPNVFPFGIPLTPLNFTYTEIVGGGSSTSTAGFFLPAGTDIPAADVGAFASEFPGAIPLNLLSLGANKAVPSQTTFTTSRALTLDKAIDKLGGTITLPNGMGVYLKGTTLPFGTILPIGTTLGAGVALPDSVPLYSATVPANVDLSLFAQATGSVTLDQTPVLAGSTLPSGTILASTLSHQSGTAGIEALAPLLAAGDKSWAMSYTAGANLAAADPRLVLTQNDLLSQGKTGSLILFQSTAGYAPGTSFSGLSVLRTGTGDLTLSAGGSITQQTQFGIYTAGTQSSDLPASSNPNYYLASQFKTSDPNYMAAFAAYQAYYPDEGGDLLLQAQGDITAPANDIYPFIGNQSYTYFSNADIANFLFSQGSHIDNIPTAWWINFGSYQNQVYSTDNGYFNKNVLVGFVGVGTLGGGNVTLKAGGNISNINSTIASTGRVTSYNSDGSAGTVNETGGGNLNEVAGGDIEGVNTNLRGNIILKATTLGTSLDNNNGSDLVIAEGDGQAQVIARNALNLGQFIDPGLESNIRAGFSKTQTLFPLDTPTSSLTLESIGGTIDINVLVDSAYSYETESAGVVAPTLPGTVNLVALTGDINAPGRGFVYYDYDKNINAAGGLTNLNLNPSPVGSLTVFAAGSYLGSANPSLAEEFSISGADPSRLVSIFHPESNLPNEGNVAVSGVYSIYDFEGNQPTTDIYSAGVIPNLVNVGGQLVSFNLTDMGQQTQINAGQGIVNLYAFLSNVNLSDVSSIYSGGTIQGAQIDIKGPGNLAISAASDINLVQDLYDTNNNSYILPFNSEVTSSGDLSYRAGSAFSGGASITISAGVGGANAPDYAGFARAYLDASSRSGAVAQLSDYSSIVKQNDAELTSYLQTNYGYTGSADQAYTYFTTQLSTAQQAIFDNQIYFEQINQSGLDYNDPTSIHFRSNIVSEDAIAALFPTQDKNVKSGDLNMTGPGGLGIHTLAGGNINILTPGGSDIVGIEGIIPPTPNGITTQGTGDVNIFARDSVNLGLSHIFTLYGGNINILAQTGDIDAGRGSNSAVATAAPIISYDNYGNRSELPSVPSTGSGIATLEFPGTSPGNIDLQAPEGTIDAGEAGVRSSGNINLNAMHVLNAANIRGAGTITGLAPVTALAGPAIASSQVVRQPTAASLKSESDVLVEIVSYGGADILPAGNDSTASQVNVDLQNPNEPPSTNSAPVTPN